MTWVFLSKQKARLHIKVNVKHLSVKLVKETINIFSNVYLDVGGKVLVGGCRGGSCGRRSGSAMPDCSQFQVTPE